jgi:hypothetical protein
MQIFYSQNGINYSLNMSTDIKLQDDYNIITLSFKILQILHLILQMMKIGS